MTTIVITGSTRGFGYAMAKYFLLQSCNVVINGRSQEAVDKASLQLKQETKSANVSGYACNVKDIDGLQNLWDFAKSKFQNVDIWINNAGVNQPDQYIWNLEKEEIDQMLDVDLKSTIYGSKIAMKGMIEQGNGSIYNIEGHGSNDNMICKLSLYGTAKRAVTYFTEALAKEAEESNSKVLVGRIAPGIMITDFLTKPLGNSKEIILDEKVNKVYRILGDYPDTIAEYVVPKVLSNQKNNVRIIWLTNRKAAKRFLCSMFKKNKI